VKAVPTPNGQGAFSKAPRTSEGPVLLRQHLEFCFGPNRELDHIIHREIAVRHCIVSLPFLLAVFASAQSGDADRASLYGPPFGLLTDQLRAELKITPEQWKSVQSLDAKRGKIWERYVAEDVKLSKLKLLEKEENAKHRVLVTQVVDELYKTYGESLKPEQVKRMKQVDLQVRGMEIFDHAEVRSALKLSDKDVKALHDAYDAAARQMFEQLQADVRAKRITQQQAAKAATNFRFGVADKPRALLNGDQRKILDDLLGEKYVYK
jgi:hypothetical protein